MPGDSTFFVSEGSIVRKIWGSADTILFIFAGSAAEFALNKAVDWLYFTGKLPADPLGRLFSTVAYARMIVFAPTEKANAAIDRITAIHSSVENARQATIPDWAYRDVLYMLIYYSISAYELLERKLTAEEKQEVFDVFFRVGARMELKNLPLNYHDWLSSRDMHLHKDLVKSEHTIDLYKQYKKHLGSARFYILCESQKMILPPVAKELLGMGKKTWLRPIVPVYRALKCIHADWLVKQVLLPANYKKQITALDHHP